MGVVRGALEHWAPEHPFSADRQSIVIKTGCNAGCLKRKVRGLRLVLEYFRCQYRRSSRVPLYVRVSSVASCFGLDGDRAVRTDIGVALSYLAQKGYLLRRSNGRNKGYFVLDKLLDHFQEYPCLKACTTDGSVCGLCASHECPFLQGLLGCGDSNDR
ncbi:MAG: hypothetical protein F7C35_03155 [Desulfurococcales archaeon]|nr:hypothetical protein [Desulfurococcales archaeon]